MDEARSCCFTGHRPDKLPWGIDENDPRCLDCKEKIRQALELVYAQGVHHFIGGMARGADLYFAEEVLKFREKYPEVTLECARPCESQAEHWSEEEQLRYWEILNHCDVETLVQHSYDRGCMMRRNRYMVDHSDWLIAVYDGVPKGGTAQTLAYALRRGLRTHIIPVEEGDT